MPTDGREALPLIDLDSVDQPFDTAVLGTVDPIAVPLSDTEFQVTRGEGDHAVTLRVDQ